MVRFVDARLLRMIRREMIFVVPYRPRIASGMSKTGESNGKSLQSDYNASQDRQAYAERSRQDTPEEAPGILCSRFLNDR